MSTDLAIVQPRPRRYVRPEHLPNWVWNTAFAVYIGVVVAGIVLVPGWGAIVVSIFAAVVISVALWKLSPHSPLSLFDEERIADRQAATRQGA